MATAIARGRPEISVDSFLLPRDERCNLQWNTLCTRSVAPLLDWYLYTKGFLDKDIGQQDAALSALLEGIVGTPEHTVVVDGEPALLSTGYLRRTDNWISNYTWASIMQAITRQLGPEYADLELGCSPQNPWLAAVRFIVQSTSEGLGLVQRLAALRDGPRAVYLDMPVMVSFFLRTSIYEVVGDYPLSARRRRTKLLRHSTNYYYIVPESIGYNAAIYSSVPLAFSQHPLLGRIPGFSLRPADVKIGFPDGDYAGYWEITIDYDITPIDRVRSWFNVGELQETVATLSAEVLELQRDRKALSEEAVHLAGQLVEEEKTRRVYQVRAAQADTASRFFHQTSNLVLQPLASTMIVFEDLAEIAADCLGEFGGQGPGMCSPAAFQERIQEVQELSPSASRAIEAYRQLFGAFYEVYVAAEPERDLNADLRQIRELMESGHVITALSLELDLAEDLPSVHFEGGVQSVFLELLTLAVQQGANRMLVRTERDEEAVMVRAILHHDGEGEGAGLKESHFVTSKDGLGLGISDVRFVVETLNCGRFAISASDLVGYSTCFTLELGRIPGA